MIRLTNFELKQFKEISQGRGGEAIVYENSREHGILYRIYIDYDKIDLSSVEYRTRYFISIKDKLPKDIVYGPIDIVYVDGKFAGYTMLMFPNGVDIDMLANDKFIATNSVNNKHSLMVMKRVNEIFRELHKLGILIGDVSGGNVMIDIASIVNKDIPKVGFIDVVSWGVDGMFPPRTYTKEFTCPDSYMPDGTINFSIKNENYALAVLNFLVLTMIHPFGGIYKPKRMKKPERMKKKLSILGPARERGDVGINDSLPSYDWMSPELKQHFLEIFEQGRRDDVYMDDINSLYANLKYCNIHRSFYDGRFNECPICNTKAKIATPVVVQVAVTGGDIVATCVFGPDDCYIILNKYIYVNKNGYIVHKLTGKQQAIEPGMKTQFSKDGRFLFMSGENEINVTNVTNGKQISTLPCAYKSMNLVSGDYFYYVDTSNALRKVRVTVSGLIADFVAYVHNALFDVEEDGKFCAVSLYPGRAMVDTNLYRFDIKCPNYIKEYAIKRDNSSKTPQWLFVFKDEKKDEFHTWLLKDSNVAEEVMIGYDYTVDKLSNISIHRGVIYIPDENKIVGISTKTGKSKEFICNTPGILSGSSAIEFTGTGFHVTNRNKEYELC